MALYDRLTATLQKIAVSYELIFVNDGSSDNTLAILEALAAQDTMVDYIDLSRNFGHQIAVTAGLDMARGKAVVIIDGDLQDPPELIEQLYQKMLSGYEVVYAKRKTRKGDSWLKKATAQFFYRLLQKITAIEVPLDAGDFRIIDRKVVDVLRKMPEQHRYLRGQISWIGFRQTFVAYDREGREYGSSGYTYKKMMRLALDGITAFSTLPLKLASLMGFLVSGISFLMIIYAVIGKVFLKSTVPGWASIMVSVLFLGGIQLISIGIIGEYISRIGSDVRRRPLYVVKSSSFRQINQDG